MHSFFLLLLLPFPPSSFVCGLRGVGTLRWWQSQRVWDLVLGSRSASSVVFTWGCKMLGSWSMKNAQLTNLKHNSNDKIYLSLRPRSFWLRCFNCLELGMMEVVIVWEPPHNIDLFRTSQENPNVFLPLIHNVQTQGLIENGWREITVSHTDFWLWGMAPVTLLLTFSSLLPLPGPRLIAWYEVME